VLRGLVMVVMALDHTRDFFAASALDPRDVSDAPLFLTRWVTHFCAPVFVFLAGTAAYLYGRKRPADLSRFLWTRGLWLVFLEVTAVRVAWTFDLLPGFLFLQVIWAIGWAMVALAALARLPTLWVGAFGVAMIAGHNLLDGIEPQDLGSLAWAWTLLHGIGPLAPPDARVIPFAVYAFVPWIGVCAAGYAFGAVFVLPRARRVRWLHALGAGVTAGFIVLRALNGYGDPRPWSQQPSALGTLLSFLNCEKYPPSLLYLLMTLGPSIWMLAFLDGRTGLARPLVTVGRVPLAYYVLHLYLIHVAAVVAALLAGDSLATLLDGFHPFSKPADAGFPLPVVYAVWLGVVLALYPFCRWFAGVKQRRDDWWLSYL
jgi:uncharacterized membrane protein